MRNAVLNYFRQFLDGQAWNQFWYEARDARTISLMRIGVGSIALFTLLCYTPDLINFFGPNGLAPAGTIEAISLDEPMAGGQVRIAHGRYLMAINYLAWFENEPSMLWVAHGVGIAVLLAFLVGYRTRVTSVLALVVMLTYFHRGQVFNSQLEPIVSLVMAYLCLGPCGAYYSVDRWLATRREGETPVAPSIGANIATRLMQIHLSASYIMMAFGKLVRLGVTDGAVWWTGDAAWWLIAKPGGSLVDLTWLHAHPFVIDAWTQAIVFFELAFGVFVWKRWARPALLALAVPMWLSLAVLTGLIPWCLMMLVANFAFVRIGDRDDAATE